MHCNDDMLLFLKVHVDGEICSSYLPLQGVDERVWVEEDRSIRETNLALSH